MEQHGSGQRDGTLFGERLEFAEFLLLRGGERSGPRLVGLPDEVGGSQRTQWHENLDMGEPRVDPGRLEQTRRAQIGVVDVTRRPLATAQPAVHAGHRALGWDLGVVPWLGDEHTVSSHPPCFPQRSVRIGQVMEDVAQSHAGKRAVREGEFLGGPAHHAQAARPERRDASGIRLETGRRHADRPEVSQQLARAAADVEHLPGLSGQHATPEKLTVESAIDFHGRGILTHVAKGGQSRHEVFPCDLLLRGQWEAWWGTQCRILSGAETKTIPRPAATLKARPVAVESGGMSTPLHEHPLLQKAPRVAGYVILEPAVLYAPLGEGGMGAVFRGYHLNLDLDVAVKCLKRIGGVQEQQLVERFRREARSGARLRHPGVMQVYDVRQTEGLHYLVMEFIEGETVRERIHRKGPLSWQEAVSIALPAARALAEVHRQNIVHRDIKPDNIMISSAGEVKLMDLGLAKPAFDLGVTASQAAFGTPQYMPPEQWRDAREVGPAADVYSLGASLYCMIMGKPGVQGESLAEVCQKATLQGIARLDSSRADLPPALVELVAKATAMKSSDRFPTAAELELALEALQVAPCDLKGAGPYGTQTTAGDIQPPPRPALDHIRTALRESTPRGLLFGGAIGAERRTAIAPSKPGRTEISRIHGRAGKRTAARRRGSFLAAAAGVVVTLGVAWALMPAGPPIVEREAATRPAGPAPAEEPPAASSLAPPVPRTIESDPDNRAVETPVRASVQERIEARRRRDQVEGRVLADLAMEHTRRMQTDDEYRRERLQDLRAGTTNVESEADREERIAAHLRTTFYRALERFETDRAEGLLEDMRAFRPDADVMPEYLALRAVLAIDPGLREGLRPEDIASMTHPHPASSPGRLPMNARRSLPRPPPR